MITRAGTDEASWPAAQEYHSTRGGTAIQTHGSVEMLSLSQMGSKPMTALTVPPPATAAHGERVPMAVASMAPPGQYESVPMGEHAEE